jgi:hypothetical protein
MVLSACKQGYCESIRAECARRSKTDARPRPDDDCMFPAHAAAAKR